MKTVYKILGVALLLIGTFFAGRYSNPTLKETSSTVAEAEDKSKEKNVETVRIETDIVKPDGTKVKQVETRRRTESKKESSSARRQDSESRIEYARPNYGIGLYSTFDKKVTVTMDRRLFGNISIGVFGRIDTQNTSDHEIGLGLRLEF